MKVGSGCGMLLGAMALSAMGMLILQAPLQGALLPKVGSQGVQSKAVNAPEAQAFKESARVSAGPGIGRLTSLPVLDPVTVDYRDDAPSATWERPGGMSKAMTGFACLLDAQCATVETCLTYACNGLPGKCEYTPVTGTGDPTCDDGLYCNGSEECNGANNCQPGIPPGTTPCTGGDVCDEVADECYPPCVIPADCDDGNVNTRDTCEPSGICVHEDWATPGRCCTGAGTCIVGNRADCATLSGVFLATAGPCGNVQPSGNTNDCPEYGSGIAPQGVWGPPIGPISNLMADPLASAGDDYETKDGAGGFFAVEFLRFAGGVTGYGSARWAIDFYDENGVFIENVFYPVPVNDSGGLGIRTVVFDPPLIIPTKGFVSFRVQPNFSPDGRVLLLPTDSVDVGTNDPGTMLANGQIRNLLGICSGGDRDGEWCDIGNGNGDCMPSGSCLDIADTLAFELVGTLTATPLSACCDAATGECTHELPWECEAQGNLPQGLGTICGICPDGVTLCEVDADCIPPDPGACMLFPTCQAGACCNPATGECSEVADPLLCQPPLVWQGFGTDCDPNCCEQPLDTGGDNCSLGIPHMIVVPMLGAPPQTTTITGDNSPATFDDYGPWTSDSIFDPSGLTKDPGWWERFQLTGCADVRIDLCCSDINGQPIRPAWAHLYDDCPTAGPLDPIGVDPPIGIGRGTSGLGYGDPFCDDDNLWHTYQLPAGMYYYPIYSAPSGTSAVPPGAQYQLHITVQACPVAACCLGEMCVIVDELACQALGGYWLPGMVTCGIQPDDNPCSTGACCLGTQCEDEAGPGMPMTSQDCQMIAGNYYGGADCDCSSGNPPPCDDPDCNLNGVHDACDITNGASTDGNANGVPDECEQACCYRSRGYPVCQGLLPDDCNVLGGTVQPPWVRCSTSNVTTQSHVSGPFTHVTDVARECPAGISRATEACIEADPIDAWQTAPDALMCHKFDVAPSAPIPADFFGPGSDPFDGEVCLQGVPLGPTPWGDFGEADTLVLRLADPFDVCASVSAARSVVDAEVVALNLESIAPITVTYNGGQNPEQWHVAVDLSEVPPMPGSIDAVKEHENGGTYSSTLNVQPRFTFTKVTDPGNVLVFDTGLEGQDHITLESPKGDDAPWAAQVIGTPRPVSPICTYFRPGIRDLEFRDCQPEGEPGHGTADGCDIANGTSLDCQRNGVPDECDIASGRSQDANGNGVPDECDNGTCEPPNPPTDDPTCPPEGCDIGCGSKCRYVSFHAGDPGVVQAIRVTIVSLPPPHDLANGRTMWVQQPTEVTEASCCTTPTPPPTMWAAQLGCTPFYTQWSSYDVVDVFDDALISNGLYEVQVIDAGAPPDQEECYSDPLNVRLSKLGDVVGNRIAPPPASPPQCVCDFNDISAVVDKFRNLPTAVRKARADLVNSDIMQPKPDLKVDFVDISCAVECFRGIPCSLPGPPMADPCAR